MRIINCMVISSALLMNACSGTNKLQAGKSPAAGIKEVEEKVVSVDPNMPVNHQYFVIIGSFNNPDNARKYQGEILVKGFTSAILKNEAGLFRVTVLSTDDIETARNNIRRIRSDFPEHEDTWLLIQKN